MEDNQAFDTKSISKDRREIFMIILSDGMSMFMREDYEAALLCWDHLYEENEENEE